MPSLADAMEWLSGKRASSTFAGESVSVTREPYTTTGVIAAVGGINEEALDQVGNVVVEHDRITFEIAAEDYLVNSEAVEPARGDLITRTAVDDDPVYEVLPRSSSEQAWRWANEPARTHYLIHAKRVA